MPMTIFFDIDNTLFDDKHAVRQACSAIQKKFSEKINVHTDDFLRIWNEALEEYFELYLKGEITFQEQRMKRVAKVFELDEDQMTHKIADEIFQIYLQEYENNWKLFPDVIPCLEKLKDETLGIISNGDFGQQSQKLRNLDIKKYFKAIIISSKVGHSKPDPIIFSYACDYIKSKPTDCIYIGDKLADDAQACEKIGMTGIWLNRNGAEKEAGNLKVIHSLEDLPSLLESAAYNT